MSDLVKSEESVLNNGSIEFIDPESEEAGFFQMTAATVRKPDYESMAFRTIEASKERSMFWHIPGTEMREVQQDVIALRGVIIKPRFGFSLYDSQNKRTNCYTVAIEPDRGPHVQDRQPMQMPIYSPQKYKTPGVADDLVSYYNPIGAKGISCVECVRRGENIIKYVDDKGNAQTDECGLNSSLIFAVMQLGISKQNLAARKIELSWVNVLDLKDIEGNQIYNSPFVANIRISRMPVTKAIGKNLQVKNATTGGYSPVDAQTLGAFLRQMHNEGLVRPARGGKVIYNSVVEMHVAQPTEAYAKDLSNLIKAIPVFNVVRDPNIVGSSVQQWISAGWSVYETSLAEAKLHGGSGGEVRIAAAEEVKEETPEAAVTPEVVAPSEQVEVTKVAPTSQTVFGRKSK